MNECYDNMNESTQKRYYVFSRRFYVIRMIKYFFLSLVIHAQI